MEWQRRSAGAYCHKGDAANKISGLIKSINWLDLPYAGHPGSSRYSLWYSEILELLYRAGQHSPFKVNCGLPKKAFKRNAINHLPFQGIRYLEMSDIAIPEREELSTTVMRCRELQSCKISRCGFLDSYISGIFEALYHPHCTHGSISGLDLQNIYIFLPDRRLHVRPNFDFTQLIYDLSPSDMERYGRRDSVLSQVINAGSILDDVDRLLSTRTTATPSLLQLAVI